MCIEFANLVNYTKRPLAVQGCSTKFPIFYFIFTVCIFFVVNLRDVEKRLTLRWDFRCVCFNLANLLFSSLLLSSYRTIFNFFRGSPAWIQLMAPVTIDCSTVISSECFKWKKKTKQTHHRKFTTSIRIKKWYQIFSAPPTLGRWSVLIIRNALPKHSKQTKLEK